MESKTSPSPELSRADMTEFLIESFEKGGYVAVKRPSFAAEEGSNPRVFLASRPDGPETEFRISVWPMKPVRRSSAGDTFGFRIEPPFESRIHEHSAHNLLLGYEPKRRLFAGFDPRKHFRYGFEPRSRRNKHVDPAHPFIAKATAEAPESILDEAANLGFWVAKAKRGQIVVVFWPEMLPFYCKHAPDVFKYASNGKTLGAIQDALGPKGLSAQSISLLQPGQLNFVQQLAEENTEANFEVRVKKAYNYTCALSGMQLWLLDAAHILRSRHEETNHEVSNGIVLQPTLHRAMDTGVIYPKYLGPGQYEFRLNRDKACELGQRRDRGTGGLDLLKPFLYRPIPGHRIPKNPEDWPSEVMIRKANKDREILIEKPEEEQKTR